MAYVQEWLHSLNGYNKLHGMETLPDDPQHPLEATPGFPLSGDLKNLDSNTLALYVNRAARLKLKIPEETFAHLPAIDPDDVMALHPTLTISAAKRILASMRFFLQKHTHANLTLKEFCFIADRNEDDVQITLAEFHEQANKNGQTFTTLSVQEWLQRIHDLHISLGQEPLPDDVNDPLQAIAGFPLSGDLNDLSMEEISVFYGRAFEYQSKYGHEKPTRKKKGIYISSKNIAALYDPMPVRSAERILQNIRFLAAKPQHAAITIKEYCHVMNENENYIQIFLTT